VITVPPMLDPSDRPDVPRGVFARISRRRPAPRRPSYDLASLAARIDEALRQVREAREYPRIRPARVEPSTALMLRPEIDGTLATMPSVPIFDGAPEPLALQRKRLERAPRFGLDELPSRCTLTTHAGFIVRMVNVSETGVLFESPLKFPRDSETALSLLGADTSLVLPARIVRSEVATVNGVGVTYQTAARFNETLGFLKKVAPPAEALQTVVPPLQIAAAPSTLADLLVCVTTELYQHHRGDAARRAFEAGLRQLVPTCDVVLCDRLVEPSGGGDSIYFAVPGASGAMVQATFAPGHEPTVEEFKLLRAAAAMASVIVHGETRALLVRRSA